MSSINVISGFDSISLTEHSFYITRVSCRMWELGLADRLTGLLLVHRASTSLCLSKSATVHFCPCS
jgi:hypothetical protein